MDVLGERMSDGMSINRESSLTLYGVVAAISKVQLVVRWIQLTGMTLQQIYNSA